MDSSPATSAPVDALVRCLLVSGMSIASMDLLSYLEPLPMHQLLLHEARSIRDWLSTDRDQLLAVVHRDMHIARHNVAELTRYLDQHSAHLSTCAGAMADSLPL